MPSGGPSLSRTQRIGVVPAVPAELSALIERARLEWLAAQNKFDTVTDPDLVDHAIYAIQAAERRYVYLLRLATRLRQEAARSGQEAVPAGREAGGTVTEERQAGDGPDGPASGSHGLSAS